LSIIDDKITAELTATKPGLILLKNDTRLLPYKSLLETEYRLVYLRFRPSPLRREIHRQKSTLTAPCKISCLFPCCPVGSGNFWLCCLSVLGVKLPRRRTSSTAPARVTARLGL